MKEKPCNMKLQFTNCNSHSKEKKQTMQDTNSLPPPLQMAMNKQQHQPVLYYDNPTHIKICVATCT